MEIQLIRSATFRMHYAGRQILTDPYLAAKGAGLSYAGGGPSPLVELPYPAQEVLAGVELVLVSHLHTDHFDPAARDLISKELAILCQPGEDAQLQEMGFVNVRSVADTVEWEGINIGRTPGQHGRGPVLDEMGQVSGFVLQAANEPTVYWAGDTVWCDATAGVIDQFQPEVILTHSAGAMWKGSMILMDAEQTVAVCEAAPDSVVIAIHLDSVDHATVSRQALRAFADSQGISAEQLRIPADGETLIF